MLASIVAARNKDVAFVVSLAGPGLRGDSLLIEQTRLIGQASGMSDSTLSFTLQLNRKVYDVVLETDDSLNTDKKLRKVIKAHYRNLLGESADDNKLDEMAAPLILQANNDWFRSFVRFDPGQYWSKVNCPVLAVNGTRDLQVPGAICLKQIYYQLNAGGNPGADIRLYPDLNHLFQHCETGLPSEYAVLKEEFSIRVLAEMTEWLKYAAR